MASGVGRREHAGTLTACWSGAIRQAGPERLHALRTMAPGAILLAAALPFLIAVAKEMAMAEEGAAFASLGSRTAGIGVAMACTATRTGLAWLVLGAYFGGMAGLAVARGLVGP
jgi:hypothetical protein